MPAELGTSWWLEEAAAALDDDVSAPLERSATPEQDRALDEAVAAAAAVGAPQHAVPLEREEVAHRIRSPLFRRGVLFPECATVQPAGLVRVLRRKAVAAGHVAAHRITLGISKRAEGYVLRTSTMTPCK
jgi:glycine/D-amino acid oxidase-like deaminating enzyme